MNSGGRYIGTLRKRVGSLASEFQSLAEEDEAVGRLLLSHHRSRHAAYWFVQAMEKILCANIFQMASGSDIRDRTSHHRMDQLVDEFVQVCLPSGNVEECVRDQIREQIREHVLQGLRFGDLHNNLRYPKFGRDGRSFAILEVSFTEASFLLNRLEALKLFARDAHKVRK